MNLDMLATRIADKPETRRFRGQGKLRASLGLPDAQGKAPDVQKGHDGFEEHQNPPRKNRKAGSLTAATTCTYLLEQLPETKWRIGKLTVRLREADEARPFALLDFHDGGVRNSGQILIEVGSNLMLHGKGAVLTQPARRSGNFVADLMAGPVKSALSDISPLRSLLVVGSGHLRQSQLALVDDEGKTRARADLILLHPQGSGQKVTLATLRGLRGYDKAFRALSAYLRGASPEREVTELVGMLFPEQHPYDPKPEVRISADDLAYDAANEIIRTHLAVARRNEAGIIADHDSEFLHDYRVALRKIRSVISLFRGTYDEEQTADLKRRFSDLMEPTGRLRDLDVYLLQREAYFALLPEAMHDGLWLMLDIFAQERRQAQRKLAKFLKGPDYKLRMIELDRLFAKYPGPSRGPDAEHPVLDYGCGLIWHRYRKTCKIAARIDKNTPDEEIHELRINCKKLRYLMELFAPLFPRAKLKVLLTPLKELQENLGLFNDYSVQQVALQEFLARHPPRGQQEERAMATSIGALITILHQRQMRERARIAESFTHFVSHTIRHEFGVLFCRKEA